MLGKFLKRREEYTNMLSADDFHAPIRAFLDPRLADLGFVRTKQCVWAREDCLSGRPVFELKHYKGAVSAPAWGFALSYVPHFNSACTKLYWHRTVKSARLDVFPFDELDQLESLSRFSSPQDHPIAVERILGDALERARAFFDEFRSTYDLLPLFNRLSRYRGDGLDYWSYTSLPLAHAFTLRVNGKYSEGRSILDRYVQRMEISGSALADLSERFEKAAASPALYGLRAARR